MPIDYKKYPQNWQSEIRPRILSRANYHCEQCGVENYAIGARDKSGTWYNEHNIHCMNSDEGYIKFGDFPKMIKIVLTVAHLNHNITDNSDDNLKALCQRCHLTYDAQYHAKNAKVTRKQRKQEKIKASGQMELFK